MAAISCRNSPVLKCSMGVGIFWKTSLTCDFNPMAVLAPTTVATRQYSVMFCICFKVNLSIWGEFVGLSESNKSTGNNDENPNMTSASS